ncbi:hypothetical protein [Prevotella sp. OH937_COT-195]|uniref:hypothetical protein n=1 Tax=Prevotella sp. OH937_COT-195 TaxID=2491051 RepID=UPI000F655AB4|nr:hypothetical protein [Prevotella sp. OH937_COT-195]RRC97845.1 hypothetical protein EII32_09905 [Prevotella sp. OH937_COT-195]
MKKNQSKNNRAYIKPEIELISLRYESLLLVKSEIQPTPGGNGTPEVDPNIEEEEELEFGAGANPAKRNSFWD